MTQPRRMLATFDIKPTSAPAGTKPDELMINWTTLPEGSTARLYFPGLNAQAIMDAAPGLYGYQPFARVDAHTIGCRAEGVGYVPIPRASGNLAGLLDVSLSPKSREGDRLTVAVSQLVSQSAKIRPRGQADANANALFYVPPGRTPARPITWRKIAGNFRLALTIQNPRVVLPIIERNLSLLRWIFESIPKDSRWRPVFVRYLEAMAGQVRDLGGDPQAILPSSSGNWRGGAPGRGPDHGERGFIGKVEGLVFDHFGDFEGFILETESGHRLHFYSRERNLQSVVERAWSARLLVTVIAQDQDDRIPRRIVLHPASKVEYVRDGHHQLDEAITVPILALGKARPKED